MAQDIMRLRRNVEVQAITMQVQIEAANSVMAIFVDVLKWVALICILVGGIGVMNILLVSVARTAAGNWRDEIVRHYTDADLPAVFV